MKANVKKQINWPQDGDGPFHGYTLRLTIGMIVKNEEKTLEKCLRSLRPLLSAVPSELIVTDTGSTDGTVEIAERFADRVLHFDWCNDFSAARNTGLEIARGEWFLFLDGDEWFEDTTELIEFFNSGECDEYGSASYIQRNYHDLSGKSYGDFHAPRIFRQYPGMHFQNMVHEAIPRREPCKFLDDYVHHYGYVHQTRSALMRKFQRNSELLKKELEIHPENLKEYYQLANEYLVIGEYDLAIDTAKAGIEIERVHPHGFWKLILTHLIAKAYYRSNDFQAVLRTVDELINSESHAEIPFLDCLYFELSAAFFTKDHEKAAEAGKEYLKLYRKYRAKKMNPVYLMATGYDFIEDKDRDEALRLTARSYIELEDKENALACLKQLDLSLPEAIIKTFPIYSAAADRFGDWSLFALPFKAVLDGGKAEQADTFVACMEATLDAHPDDYTDLLRVVTGIGSEDNYSLLCRLRLSEREDDHPAAGAILDCFADSGDELDHHYSDILYYAMEEKKDVSPYLPMFTMEGLSLAAENIRKQHPDFADTAVKDYETCSSENHPKALYWLLCLLEKAALTKAEDKDSEGCTAFLERYAALSQPYLRAAYQSDFLKENLSLLPGVCRFMYWVNAAFAAKKRSDGAAYLNRLKSALKAYPIMKDAIQLLLNRFEDEEEEQQKNADEFFALAKEMKKHVGALIAQGSLQKARQITMQLAALLPEDPDIQQFLELTGAGQPPVPEMLSHLPQ